MQTYFHLQRYACSPLGVVKQTKEDSLQAFCHTSYQYGVVTAWERVCQQFKEHLGKVLQTAILNDTAIMTALTDRSHDQFSLTYIGDYIIDGQIMTQLCQPLGEIWKVHMITCPEKQKFHSERCRLIYFNLFFQFI